MTCRALETVTLILVKSSGDKRATDLSPAFHPSHSLTAFIVAVSFSRRRCACAKTTEERSSGNILALRTSK